MSSPSGSDGRCRSSARQPLEQLVERETPPTATPINGIEMRSKRRSTAGVGGPPPRKAESPVKPNAGRVPAKAASSRFHGGTMTGRKLRKVDANCSRPVASGDRGWPRWRSPQLDLALAGRGMVLVPKAMLQNGYRRGAAHAFGGRGIQPARYNGQRQWGCMACRECEQTRQSAIVSPSIIIAPP